MFYHDDICNLCFRKGSVFTDEHIQSRKSLETQKVRGSPKRFTRNEAATWTSTAKILKCTAELKFQKQAQLCLRVDSVPAIMVRNCLLGILTEVIKKSSLMILHSIFILDKNNDQSNTSGGWGNNNGNWDRK